MTPTGLAYIAVFNAHVAAVATHVAPLRARVAPPNTKFLIVASQLKHRVSFHCPFDIFQ